MSNLNDETEKQILRQARLLKETFGTEGWKQIIEPLLDKMIMDVVGAKVKGRWSPGSFGDKTLSNVESDRLLWYRQALIEFHTHLMSHLDMAEGIKQKRRDAKNSKVKSNESPYSHVDEGGAIWGGGY